MRIQLEQTQSLVGASRDEAEAAELMYSKLQAQLVESEAAREAAAEDLRKRVDLKTSEAAKYAAEAAKYAAVLESFQLEREQSETRLKDEICEIVEARDSAQKRVDELQAK